MSTKKSNFKLNSKLHSKLKYSTISKKEDDKLDKVILELREAFAKVDKDDSLEKIATNLIDSEKKLSKKLSTKYNERANKLMYSMNGKKSKKRNMYHYYYSNPFKIVWSLITKSHGIPEIFDEKLFSMLISLKFFNITDNGSNESVLMLMGMSLVLLPHAIIWSIFHKLSLLIKLPYAIYAKIKTNGSANEVEKLFKTIMNDIYSNDKYQLLQDAADSKYKTNKEEPHFNNPKKKFSFEFIAKLVSLFTFLSLREMEINGKTYGFHEEIGAITISKPITLIKKNLLNIYNENSKDDILSWFQNNYTFINLNVNLVLPVLTITQNVQHGMSLENMMVQNEQFQKAYEELKKKNPNDKRLQNFNPGQMMPVVAPMAQQLQIPNQAKIGFHIGHHHMGHHHMGHH